MTWAMVESLPALDNLEAIVATPGLDGVYVGPNDLALALGERPGQARPPQRTRDALARVVDVAHAAGVWAGLFCADGQVAREMVELGFDLVTPGNDVGVMRAAAARAIAAARGDAEQVTRGGGY